MTVQFSLANVWTGNGGEFLFQNNAIQATDNVTANDVAALFTTIKNLCAATSAQAFPNLVGLQNTYGTELFAYVLEHLSIQTRTGLVAYIMVGARNGKLEIRGNSIRFVSDSGQVRDVLGEYRSAVVFAMQTAHGLDATYGPALFRSLLSKIEVVE